MSLESTVGIAKIGTKSLRATVPEGIVVFLSLNEGDKLSWKMDILNGERIAVVSRAKQSEEMEKKAEEISTKYRKSAKGKK
jgi:hypothetical protein